MDTIQIDCNRDIISGSFHLTGSKSISNRMLIIRALSGLEFQLENLSESEDTRVLMHMLNQSEGVHNAGHAGTSFRFMTAYLAIQEGEQILTGSERMKQRPIGPLVDALNEIGANITYMEREGFPPLRISPPQKDTGGVVNVPGDVSSQFLSALLLIAPYCGQGIELNILGELVSKPYLMMTTKLIQSFGIEVMQTNTNITIKPGEYRGGDFYVEGDWSSASYFYEICALSTQASVRITGLDQNSLQGDARITEFAEHFGVRTDYGDRRIELIKTQDFETPEMLEFNLIEQPDLCQTLVCICAGLGISALFSGLKTLRIKETDRIEALYQELLKLGVHFTELPGRFSPKTSDEYFLMNGQVEAKEERISIATYQDHRMAMAFAPLSMITPLTIQHPDVVHKSFPSYWEVLKEIGFQMDV